MPVRLQVLGGLRAYQTDRDLSWVPGQPVRSALLLYLSIEREATREQLARIFWPDQELERARHSLSQFLYLLRRALGQAAIEQHGEFVRLAIPVQTDAADFEAAVEAGDFERAASLYRGGFLRDVHLCGSRDFEEWVDRQRARLDRLHRRVRRGQIEARLAARDIPAAIEAAREWSTIEPFEDEAQHRLIELLAMAGQRQEALEQYEAYERLLRSDELEPLDDTKALVTELRAGRGAVAETTTMAALAVPPPPTAPVAQPASEAVSPSPARPRRRLAWIALLAAIPVFLAATQLWRRQARLHAPTVATPDTASIAVIPFANLSGEPHQDYLGDGVSEELLNALGRIEGLRVPSSTDAFVFKGRNATVKTIATALNVRYVVDGSVRRSGKRVRISAQLVDARDASVRWSQTYDRETPDILALQDEIAGAIVGELKPKLLITRRELQSTRGTANPEAWDAFVQGRAAAVLFTSPAFQEAARDFRRAVELDPRFARARSGLAVALARMAEAAAARARDVQREEEAARQAQRALELDPNLSEPHIVLALLAALRGDQQRRSRELDAALRAEPGSRDALYASGMYLAYTGERPEARLRADRLVAGEPYSPNAHYMAATILNHVGDAARADSLAALGLRLDSLRYGPAAKWPPFWNRGYANLLMRRYDRAAEFLPLAYIDADSGKARATRLVLSEIAALTRAGLPPGALERRAAAVIRQQEGKLQPFVAAALYLQFGARDDMYRLLASKPLEMGFGSAVYDPVSRENRYLELRQRAADMRRRP